MATAGIHAGHDQGFRLGEKPSRLSPITGQGLGMILIHMADYFPLGFRRQGIALNQFLCFQPADPSKSGDEMRPDRFQTEKPEVQFPVKTVALGEKTIIPIRRRQKPGDRHRKQMSGETKSG